MYKELFHRGLSFHDAYCIPLLTIVVIGLQKSYTKTEVGVGLELNDVY
jgi:hypothetical protein